MRSSIISIEVGFNLTRQNSWKSYSHNFLRDVLIYYGLSYLKIFWT